MYDNSLLDDDFFDGEPEQYELNQDTNQQGTHQQDTYQEEYSHNQGTYQEEYVPNQESESTNNSYVLYIVIDKPIVGLVNYLRESGVKVSNIFHDIKEAKNSVLMQSEPTRIVVVDTGMGKFTTTAMRAELIDMLGISDDQNKTTVFYTDSVLKVDTMRSLGKSGKHIDWVQYSTTSVMAATLLNYGENYIYDMEDSEDTFDDASKLLSFKGVSTSDIGLSNVKLKGLSASEIREQVFSNSDNEIPSYEPVY